MNDVTDSEWSQLYMKPLLSHIALCRPRSSIKGFSTFVSFSNPLEEPFGHQVHQALLRPRHHQFFFVLHIKFQLRVPIRKPNLVKTMQFQAHKIFPNN
ncbi:hypothetical protein CEXT_705741 [Caerostris extrusa]|uniref:Uncharacterized protein n=1 Tax=Caerostris extrusa TaxID=172846 RepID=A0AAV4SEK5_CAEEX|nr:hypothetical protein CEXT_705741 [Caerostris extrusa]